MTYTDLQDGQILILCLAGYWAFGMLYPKACDAAVRASGRRACCRLIITIVHVILVCICCSSSSAAPFRTTKRQDKTQDQVSGRTNLHGAWGRPRSTSVSKRTVGKGNHGAIELYRVYGHDAQLEPFLAHIATYVRRIEAGMYLAVLNGGAADQVLDSAFVAGIEAMDASMKVSHALQASLETERTSNSHVINSAENMHSHASDTSYARVSWGKEQAHTSIRRAAEASKKAELFVLAAVEAQQIPAQVHTWTIQVQAIDPTAEVHEIIGGKMLVRVREEMKDDVVRMLASEVLVRWVEEKRTPTVRNKWATKVIHTCIHACIHACIHTHGYIHAYMHAYIHTDMHTYIHACMHTYIHICSVD